MTLYDVVAVLPLVSVATKLIVLFVADVTFGAVAETCWWLLSTVPVICDVFGTVTDCTPKLSFAVIVLVNVSPENTWWFA